MASWSVLRMAKDKKDVFSKNLLDRQPVKITIEFEKQDVRAINIGAKYAKAIALTLNECELNRDEIATLMSDC